MRTAQKITEALRGAGGDVQTLTAFLVRTGGHATTARYDGFSEQQLEKKTEDLKQLFDANGIATTVLPPLPLETATLYWSAAARNEIFAVGERRTSLPAGGFAEPALAARGVDTVVVPLDAKK